MAVKKTRPRKSSVPESSSFFECSRLADKLSCNLDGRKLGFEVGDICFSEGVVVVRQKPYIISKDDNQTKEPKTRELALKQMKAIEPLLSKEDKKVISIEAIQLLSQIVAATSERGQMGSG